MTTNQHPSSSTDNESLPREIVQVQLDTLQPHPKQQLAFLGLSDAEDAALRDDMEKHGLQHPVEILPDRTIIAGHRRVAAAKALGWTKIDAIVRHDLVEQGELAICPRVAVRGLVFKSRVAYVHDSRDGRPLVVLSLSCPTAAILVRHHCHTSVAGSIGNIRISPDRAIC